MPEYNDKQIASLLQTALADLYAAEGKMMEPTKPITKLGRFRKFFWVHPNIHWPLLVSGDSYRMGFVSMQGTGSRYDTADGRRDLALKLVEANRHQPRRILRTLYRIRATTEWCIARAEGRKRAAEEILKQQAKALQTLEEEAAMRSLKS